MRITILLLLISFLIPFNAFAKWTASKNVDELSGKVSAYAIGSTTKPTKPLSFPYADTTSTLAYGCSKENQWAYIHFNKDPNLTDGDIADGYNIYTSRARWDKSEVTTIKYSQKFGSKFVFFLNDDYITKKIQSSGKLLFGFSFYSDGERFFHYDLSGSTNAINQARKMCGYSK